MIDHLDDPTKSLFSLIILDYNIPHMSGLEVLKKAKQEYDYREKEYPKVIMMTVITDTRLKDRCYKDEVVNCFLKKPPTNEILKEKVYELLRN